MAFQIFAIPATGCANGERALNRFLASHQILNVERRLIEQGAAAYWTFCVDDVDAAAANGDGSPTRPGPQRGKIDYREVLTPPQFALFSRLRDARKKLAQTQGSPVYTVFTNEQLAQMVLRNASSKSDLESIVGVGDARVAKFGDSILKVLVAARGSSNETSQPTV